MAVDDVALGLGARVKFGAKGFFGGGSDGA